MRHTGGSEIAAVVPASTSSDQLVERNLSQVGFDSCPAWRMGHLSAPRQGGPPHLVIPLVPGISQDSEPNENRFQGNVYSFRSGPQVRLGSFYITRVVLDDTPC